MAILRFEIGDVLVMKKKHPCGADRFKVMRLGSDIRICCMGCGHDIMLSREKVEKMVKAVSSPEQ